MSRGASEGAYCGALIDPPDEGHPWGIRYVYMRSATDGGFKFGLSLTLLSQKPYLSCAEYLLRTPMNKDIQNRL